MNYHNERHFTAVAKHTKNTSKEDLAFDAGKFS
jgi:hypothetical protein